MDEELYDLLKQKRKIEAVKYIRNKYDMDFKSAKETIDKMTKTLEYFEGKNHGLSKEDFHDMFKNSIISRIYDNDLYALIRENRKIEAVKYVKDKYNFEYMRAFYNIETTDKQMVLERINKRFISRCFDFLTNKAKFAVASLDLYVVEGKFEELDKNVLVLGATSYNLLFSDKEKEELKKEMVEMEGEE